MLEVLNSPEIQRLSLVIGALLAVQYKDRYGVIPGGIIIPGFLIAQFLYSPIWCFTLIALTFPIGWSYQHILHRPDYKRRTPMYILAVLSLVITSLIALAFIHLGWFSPSLDTLSGMLIPAILSYTCTRQKAGKVFKGTILVTLLTAAIVFLIYAVSTYGFNLNLDLIRPFEQGKDTLELKYPLFQFGCTLLAGYLIYRIWNVRSGGYMITPIVAGLLIQPFSALMFLLGCGLTYGLTRMICELTLTIGLKRYVLALWISTIFVWVSEIALIRLDSTVLPFQGSDTFAIIAIMSYANDAILYAKKNIFIYMAITLIMALITLLISHLLARIFI
jgi:hypothetical protein